MKLAKTLLTSLSVAALLATMAPAIAQQPDTGHIRVGASGDFLSGQQAFYELRTGEAVRYLANAARADWDNPILVSRALEALVANGEVDDAAGMARHMLDLDNRNETAHMVLAAKALKERRYDAVAPELEAIGDDTFTGITATLLEAWADIGNGDYDASKQTLEPLVRNGLDEFLNMHRALMADVAGNADEAAEFARTAFDAQPLVPRYVETYARILAEAGNFEESARVLKSYEDAGLKHPVLDEITVKVGARTSPGKLVDTAQAGAAEMLHALAQELTRDGRSDAAVIYMQLALYLDPGSDLLALDLGQIFENLENYEGANAIYDGIASTSPLKANAEVRTASNLNEMNQREKAIGHLQGVLASEPSNIDVLAALGDLYRADENYEEAISTYTRVLDAVDTRASNWYYYYLRGIAHERSKQWPQAEADFLKALELSPNQSSVLNYLGYTWVDKGMNLDQALGMIEKAVAAQPNNGSIVDSLGWAYYRLGRYEDAVGVLERAVRIESESAEINDHLGDAYWTVGREREARFQWRIASYLDEEGGLVQSRARQKLVGGLDAVPQPAPVAAPEEAATALN